MNNNNIEGETIGIDLGTTYSCVGVWINDKVEIIANDQGNRTTPSWVAFTDTEKLVGESAKNQVTSNHTNTIYDVKRLIGYKYTDPIIQNELNKLNYQVSANKNDIPTNDLPWALCSNPITEGGVSGVNTNTVTVHG